MEYSTDESQNSASNYMGKNVAIAPCKNEIISSQLRGVLGIKSEQLEELHSKGRLLSLENQIPIVRVRQFLPERIQTLLLGGPTINLWATRTSNHTIWERLKKDDYVIFYGMRKMTYVTKIVATFESPEISKLIWGPSWDLIMFLNVLKFVNVEWKEVCDAVGYDLFYPQKFMSPRKENMARFVEVIESLVRT